MIEPVGLGTLWYVLAGLAGGLLGSILGLGGGILIVPILTLLLGLPMHMAVATSLAAVAATSVASSAGYLKRDLPLVRLGLTLELATVVGAIFASNVAGWLSGQVLEVLFAAMLLYTAASMWRGERVRPGTEDLEFIPATPLALLGSAGAGALSGALGVGGGVACPHRRARRRAAVRLSAKTVAQIWPSGRAMNSLPSDAATTAIIAAPETTLAARATRRSPSPPPM